jgi:hypothetical protein
MGAWMARGDGITIAGRPDGSNPSAPVVNYSPGVAEILKLANAKVDPNIIKAYVKNSPIPYNLSAGEIIGLEQQGVPEEIITAMMQRGGELRAQMSGAGAYAGVPQPYAPQQPYPDYGYDSGYPDYSAYNYPAYETYPYYSWGYPWGLWPYSTFSFGFYGDRFHHFNHGDRFGHFHGSDRFGSHSGFSHFSRPGLNNFSGHTFSGSRSFTAPRSGFSGGGTFHSGGGFRSGGGFHSGGSFGGGHGGGRR